MILKILSYLLIVAGICSWIGAASDEHRGVAVVTPPSRSPLPEVADQKENPAKFAKLIAYEWGRGLLFVTAGCMGLVICRKADRINPFSTE